jgi:DNA topoisomerase-1
MDVAGIASLHDVADGAPGIARRRARRGFAYRSPAGGPVRDAAALKRSRALAIPPARRQVWIRPDADGHVQATGRDERGRKQCRYHAPWREQRDATRHRRLIAFARTLPRLRTRVSEGMARRELPRETVLATAVHLVEATLIRIGNADRVRTNGSRGLATLRGQRVATEASELRFEFRGRAVACGAPRCVTRAAGVSFAPVRNCQGRICSATSTRMARPAPSPRQASMPASVMPWART